MNYKQSDIESREQALIEKVLNYKFFIGNQSICLSNIADKLELESSMSGKPQIEILTPDEILELKNEVKRLNEKIVELENWFGNNGWSYNGRTFIYQKDNCTVLNGNYPDLIDRRDNINNIIHNGEIEIIHTGSFDGKGKKVYLYLNIIDAYKPNRIEVLITTFIHEMFHAWNFFASGEKFSSVREIDEPMVEFDTLFFLKSISESDSDFKPILSWAKQSIYEKKYTIGKVAAYGYGFYMFSLIGKQEEKSALDMIREYPNKSGDIQDTNTVKQVKEALCPCYPFEKEKDVLSLLYQILFSGKKMRNSSTQKQQLIEALRQLGGYAELENIYNKVDTSTWSTKTPKASIRRTLQSAKEIFMIEKGLWGLEESRSYIETLQKQGKL